MARQSAFGSIWPSDAASVAHPEFGSSANPITTTGADYTHHITASPPGIENPAASLWPLVHILYYALKQVFKLSNYLDGMENVEWIQQ